MTNKTSTGQRRRRPRLLLAALVLALWMVVAFAGARFLVVETAYSKADALVVLSGADAYAERTWKAAQLFHEGRAPIVILTDDKLRAGWSQAEERNPWFVERARGELQGAGVPLDDIIVLPDAVDSTYVEATVVRRYAETKGLHSLLVVTSPYHSRRALWTFRQVFKGSNVSITVSTATTESKTTALTWWFSPRGWRNVAGEYLKLIYYRLKY